MFSLDMIYDARNVLKGITNNTPLVSANDLCDAKSFQIKLENLQLTGSFKMRGAYNKISRLTEQQRKNGVIACSAGNHAQGVALAARMLSISADICMPETAPLSKIENTKAYGANVILSGNCYDDAYAKAVEVAAEKGSTFIHPFNDPFVMAGQGTIALEVLEKCPEVDVVLIPVGGGGLAAGISFAIKSIRPSCLVYGVEPKGAASMQLSLKNKKPTTLPSMMTISDGVAVKTPGDLTFDVCQKTLDGIITISEEETASAILTLMEKQKLVTEGSGAVSVAAAMYNKLDFKGKNVVAINSGGNIDVNIIERVISNGLAKSGRSTKISTVIADKPNNLRNLLDIFSSTGANIVSINHDRANNDAEIGFCVVDIVAETRNKEHIQHLRATIKQKGYKIV